MMKYKTIFNTVKDFLARLTDVLVPVVSVLGENGLVGLLVAAILIGLLNK